MKGNTCAVLSSDSGHRMAGALRVLVAEPDPMLRSLYKDLVVEGGHYVLAGTVATGAALFPFLARTTVHLVLLDVFLPDLGGTDGLRRLRQDHPRTDFVVLSSGERPDVVRDALCIGAFDFLVKPFSFGRLRSTLQAYILFYRGLTQKSGPWRQEELDCLLTARRERPLGTDNMAFPPKGLQAKLLQDFLDVLRSSETPLSAQEAGCRLQVARSTARRYLEHLVTVGKVSFEYGYREIGRPVKSYSLLISSEQKKAQTTISTSFS